MKTKRYKCSTSKPNHAEKKNQVESPMTTTVAPTCKVLPRRFKIPKRSRGRNRKRINQKEGRKETST